MQLFNKYWQIGILACLILFSCRELVTDQFADFDAKPVVNAFLVEGATFKVNVSLAEKLDTNKLAYVDDAAVELYIDGHFAEKAEYDDLGWYFSDIVIEPSKTYKCNVSIPGFEAVQCEQTLPPKPVIVDVTHINISGKNEEGVSYPAIILTIENIPGQKQYFEVQLRSIQELGYIRDCGIQPIVDQVILNEGLPLPLFSNESIADSVYSLYLNYTTFHSSRKNDGPTRTVLYPLVVELRSVSYDYYRYKKQLHLYNEGRYAEGIINSMINTNLYSNVDGGFGVFSSYSYVLSDTIKPNTEGYYE